MNVNDCLMCVFLFISTISMNLENEREGEIDQKENTRVIRFDIGDVFDQRK